MKYLAKTLFSFAITSSLIFSSCNQKNAKKEFNKEDYKLVNTAIQDYVEGLYFVDSTKIDRSVDKKMRKIGYYYSKKTKTYRDNLEMTHTQLSNLAARWNKDGKNVNKNSPKEIEIFDVNSKTASAKLTAQWGIDLFHLAKVNNQWKIVNVMWQSMPKKNYNE